MEPIRERTTTYIAHEGYEGVFRGNGSIHRQGYFHNIGTDFSLDENHYPYYKNSVEKGDNGGPFSSWHYRTSKIRYVPIPGVQYPLESHPSFNLPALDNKLARFVVLQSPFYYLASDFLPNLAGYHYPWSTLPGAKDRVSMNDLVVFGTKSVKETVPNKPSVNIAVSLGELVREGIPSLVGAAFLKDRSAYFRNLGSEYLNVQFGWAPFIRDLQSLASLGQTANHRLQQWARDSGRIVRRNRTFEEDEVTYDVTGSGQFCTPSGLQIPGSSSLSSRTTGTVHRKWRFSAAYTYYVPPAERLNGLAAYESQMNILLGTRITPEVLWNLAPWTWLADWFANIGDIIANISALSTDELVMHYGYASFSFKQHEHRSQTVIHPGFRILEGAPYYGRGGFVHDMDIYYENRDRIVASPFGFGLTLAGLFFQQLAILGALGLSRGPRNYFPRK
jgi:hypothetical protein